VDQIDIETTGKCRYVKGNGTTGNGKEGRTQIALIAAAIPKPKPEGS
jgi:hypothetical protein